jgi:hypothetical protein
MKQIVGCLDSLLSRVEKLFRSYTLFAYVTGNTLDLTDAHCEGYSKLELDTSLVPGLIPVSLFILDTRIMKAYILQIDLL